MAERVDYDRIAGQYESRYERNDYSGIMRALMAFVGESARSNPGHILEAGCGTGHWIDVFRKSEIRVVGLDPSEGMLKVARTRLADARLIRARAEALPFAAASFKHLFCVNALHHFHDPEIFFHEARRVLVNGGGLLTAGLDPHAGRDRWWIYDYFPAALIEDRRRYLPAAKIRQLMQAAGFSACETREVQHMPARMTVGEAERRGFLERASTSQLMVIADAEFETGMKRIRDADADAGGETVLRSDLRLYGTTGSAGS